MDKLLPSHRQVPQPILHNTPSFIPFPFLLIIPLLLLLIHDAFLKSIATYVGPPVDQARALMQDEREEEPFSWGLIGMPKSMESWFRSHGIARPLWGTNNASYDGEGYMLPGSLQFSRRISVFGVVGCATIPQPSDPTQIIEVWDLSSYRLAFLFPFLYPTLFTYSCLFA